MRRRCATSDAGNNYIGDNSSLIDGFDIAFAKLVRRRDAGAVRNVTHAPCPA